ncbi:hypothetical protein SAMN04515674_11780 [Pseudarcicella hirudinis]|uniref:Alpha/beta hydrolase family protein n=1 Tax=Pseudarcicella hirudinis TaxID=1079859 RepID=A0A1I5Y7X5_9BACT|nr:hypothetical protein [Pseudarcicella hirudinis]SFQ40284.1 hypothetical protein SAMN04515674_11780 [Pseudarcicella hirudinis]
MRQKMAIIGLLIINCCCSAVAQVWQWSAPVEGLINAETNANPQAFLWIPENCKNVRGVVIGMHNMVEEGMLENTNFRKTLSKIGFAEIWVTPVLEVPFDFHGDAPKHFQTMMNSLAKVSGYKELATAPIVPIGHSAMATYPWNFAAWNPQQTLAVVSVHGDTPQTNLTGYGRANVDWENRNIEGIPGLFIMGEYEWWEKRLEPGFKHVAKYPKTPITFFADAGHGHFDYNDAMVDYVGLFIEKAAKYRLSKEKNRSLRPVYPQNGWLIDRWRKDSLPKTKPQPYHLYQGNKYEASWCFDEAHAKVTEAYYAKARGKKIQYLGFLQEGKILLPVKNHAVYQPGFKPLADGNSFQLKAFFTDSLREKAVSEHPETPLLIDRICGPVKKLNDSTFQLSFYRIGFNNQKRSNSIWLLAHNDGDDTYKSAVQQLEIKFPLKNTQGTAQSIAFGIIPNQKTGVRSINLNGFSSSDLPVSYYVKEGPAYIENERLIFTKIPPKAKFPIKVTVIAWQYGIAGKVQSAEPVEQCFEIYQ